MIVVTYLMAATLSAAVESNDPRVRPDRHRVVGAVHLSSRRRGPLVAANVLFAAGRPRPPSSTCLPTPTRPLSGFVFVAASLLYLVAPVAIVRHVAYRPRGRSGDDARQALAAYLLIGMAFAFAYRSVGAIETAPFFGADGEGDDEPGPVLQLRDPHDDRLRQPGPRPATPARAWRCSRRSWASSSSWTTVGKIVQTRRRPSLAGGGRGQRGRGPDDVERHPLATMRTPRR